MKPNTRFKEGKKESTAQAAWEGECIHVAMHNRPGEVHAGTGEEEPPKCLRYVYENWQDYRNSGRGT